MLRDEGGYVNNPKDPGGATNLGVTKHTWESWVGHTVSLDAIKALKPADVMPLYRKRYWDACRCDDLPAGLDYAVLDTAVNSGVTKASKLLQQGLRLPIDGIIGPQTVQAAQISDVPALIDWYMNARLAFLKGLGAWDTFGGGWYNRIVRVRDYATNIAATS